MLVKATPFTCTIQCSLLVVTRHHWQPRTKKNCRKKAHPAAMRRRKFEKKNRRMPHRKGHFSLLLAVGDGYFSLTLFRSKQVRKDSLGGGARLGPVMSLLGLILLWMVMPSRKMFFWPAAVGRGSQVTSRSYQIQWMERDSYARKDSGMLSMVFFIEFASRNVSSYTLLLGFIDIHSVILKILSY